MSDVPGPGSIARPPAPSGPQSAPQSAGPQSAPQSGPLSGPPSGPVPVVNLCGLVLPGTLPATLPAVPGAGGRALAVMPDLPSALARHPEGRVLVVLADPAEDIARRLHDGHAPSAALAAWESRTREILPDLRRHRRRVALVTDTMLAARAEDVDGPLGEAARALPAALHLIARFALQADPKVRDLAGEIRAMLPAGAPEDGPNGGPHGGPDIGIADRAFAEMQAQGTASDALSDRQERLRAMLELRQAELASAERGREAWIETGCHRESVLGAVLMARCDELDGYRQRCGSLEAAAEAQTGEIARLRDELERMYRSTSWRVTAPLRAVGRALRRR